VPSAIHIRARQEVPVLLHRAHTGLLHVFTGIFHIAQVHQLPKRFAVHVRYRFGGRVPWVHATCAFHLFPRRDHLQFRRVHENIQQRAPVHVARRGQAEEREQGGGDVQQAGTVHQFVLFDARALDAENAIGAVFVGRSGGFAGQRTGPQVVRVEPVVGDQDHRGLFAGQFQQPSEHQVMETVGGRHHALVQVEFALRDVRPTGRMELHEAMLEVVDRIVVHPCEVPFFALQDIRGGRMHGGAIGQHACDGDERSFLVLVHLREVRDEGRDMGRGEFRRVDPQPCEFFAAIGRMHRARPHGPPLVDRFVRALVKIAHHHPVDGLRRMAGPPPQHVRAFPFLGQDVPYRLHAPVHIGYRA
jgi:hypothetical protein